MRDLADEHGLRLHMDGARLLNAAVGSGTPAATFASYVDSVWIDLSKGLGAPVGAVLAGTREFIERARLLKHMLGGAMRQAGIIAAGGIYALEHHIERLSEDHANARFLADGLAAIPGVELVYDTVPTNILFFDVSGTGMTPQEVERGINALGVRMGGGYDGAKVIRAVTHLDVSREDCARAVEAVREVCAAGAQDRMTPQSIRPEAVRVH
jgi:threonine aldolase